MGHIGQLTGRHAKSQSPPPTLHQCQQPGKCCQDELSRGGCRHRSREAVGLQKIKGAASATHHGELPLWSYKQIHECTHTDTHGCHSSSHCRHYWGTDHKGVKQQQHHHHRRCPNTQNSSLLMPHMQMHSSKNSISKVPNWAAQHFVQCLPLKSMLFKNAKRCLLYAPGISSLNRRLKKRWVSKFYALSLRIFLIHYVCWDDKQKTVLDG